MKENTERTDSHATRDAQVARAINIPWPDNDVRHSVVLAVFSDNFVLFDFRETVGVACSVRLSFNWTRLIEHLPTLFLSIGIDCERADVDESPQPRPHQGCLDQISCSYHGVHECVRKRFLAPGRRQVEDDSDVLACIRAVFTREKIASNHLKPRPEIRFLGEPLEFCCIARWPGETP